MKIEQAVESDVDTLSRLMAEIEAYYRSTHLPAGPAQVRQALFGARPAATVLLARADGGEVLGMAAYTLLWPVDGGHTSLYLKELFVRSHARRRGVAGALMERLREIAGELGCLRVEWTADDDNPPALAFYDALGAHRHQGKVFYRSPL